MTHAEKIALAVERELTILRETSQAFDGALAACLDLAAEFRAGVTRLEKIQADEDTLDVKIDDLDRLMSRGKYRTKSIADMTMDELARHFGGA